MLEPEIKYDYCSYTHRWDVVCNGQFVGSISVDECSANFKRMLELIYMKGYSASTQDTIEELKRMGA